MLTKDRPKLLAELSSRLNIATETTFNPVYNMTNNLASLWLTRQEFDEDAVISNGNNLCLRKCLIYFKDIGLCLEMVR